MKKRRRFMAGLLALPLLLTACSSRVPTGTQPVGDPAHGTPGQIVTIKVMDDGSPVFDSFLAGFYQKYPTYRIEKVQFQPSPGTDFTQYIKDQLNQGAADVVSIFDRDAMAKENLLLPLEPFIQKAKFDLKPYGPALDALKYEGKLYVLPLGISPQFLVYNRDLFQSAGVAIPKGGWTWAEFRTAAAKVAKGDGASRVWGFWSDFPDSLPQMYVQTKTGYAGPFPPADDLQEALAFYRTMIFTDKSMPPAEQRDHTSTSGGPMPDAFNQGQAGMAMEYLPGLRHQGAQTKFRWDIAPMPTTPGGKNQTYVHPQTMGIAASSKQPQAAWDFLMYAAGPAGAALLAKQGELPMYQSADVKKAWFAQQPAPPAGSEFLFATTYAIITPDKTFSKRLSQDQQQQALQVFGRMQNAINAVMSGDKPLDDAIRDYSQAAAEGRQLFQ